MQTLGYYNGEIGEVAELRIPMNDRASWFGDGVYDATGCANYTIFALDEHVDRFFNSAGLVQIDLPLTKQELKDLLCSLVKKLDSPDQFVYWQATRGTAPRAHEFPENARANLWITLRPHTLPNIYEKVKLRTQEDTRFLHCNIKTLNLLPNVLASEQAKREGCFETVFHRGDRVTECAHSNVHIFQNGALRTAPTDNLILPGIARAHLIKHCKLLGIPVDETAFTVQELLDADEVFTSSSNTFCQPACLVDGRPVGGKAPGLLKKLQDAVLCEFYAATGAKNPYA
ncbi:MAG: aminotransferase class IV [Oscillospiraceae bacterium]|nr:aminotransferase class IV [Oscillospiraceae bacterium]